MRLRSLAEVIDHLGSSGTTGIVDGTEIRVRRPAAGRKDRDQFISGRHRVLTTSRLPPVGGHRRLHRRYERKAEHFLAFVGIAAALIGYRRLATPLRA